MPEPIQQTPTEVIAFEYQHTDEQGNPIIDPRTGKQVVTNFTGKDWKEIAEKTRDAHVNVTRALNRARNHKPVPREAEPQPKTLTAEEERQAAIDLQDPSKAKAAARKLTGIDEIEARQKRLDEQKFELDVAAARLRFVNTHGVEGFNDYYPCMANSNTLMKYITDEGLDPRVAENYEVAFNAVANMLAQRPVRPQATPPANEPPPPPIRPAAGGIQPGELTGARPQRRPKNEVTKEMIREMTKTPEGRADFRKRMKDPSFVAQVNALGVRPSGNFF